MRGKYLQQIPHREYRKFAAWSATSRRGQGAVGVGPRPLSERRRANALRRPGRWRRLRSTSSAPRWIRWRKRGYGCSHGHNRTRPHTAPCQRNARARNQHAHHNSLRGFSKCRLSNASTTLRGSATGKRWGPRPSRPAGQVRHGKAAWPQRPGASFPHAVSALYDASAEIPRQSGPTPLRRISFGPVAFSDPKALVAVRVVLATERTGTHEGTFRLPFGIEQEQSPVWRAFRNTPRSVTGRYCYTCCARGGLSRGDEDRSMLRKSVKLGRPGFPVSPFRHSDVARMPCEAAFAEP